MGDENEIPELFNRRLYNDIVDQSKSHDVQADLRIDHCPERIPDLVAIRFRCCHRYSGLQTVSVYSRSRTVSR